MLSYCWWYLLPTSFCLIYYGSTTNLTATPQDYEFNTTTTTNFTEETIRTVTTESPESSSENGMKSLPRIRILTRIETPLRSHGYWPNRRNKVPHTGGKYPSRVPHTGRQYPSRVPHTGGQYPSRVPNNRPQYPRQVPTNRAQYPRRVINTRVRYPIRIKSSRIPYSTFHPESPTYNRGHARGSETFNIYNPGKPQSVSDVCPQFDAQILINGLPCPDAIDRFGLRLCYTYEHYYKSCCEKCLQVKEKEKIGCEYGDHSFKCTNLLAYQCYEHYNRAICCETCKVHREKFKDAIQNCEYGDMSPRCKYITPAMCYQQNIERLCCETCPRFKKEDNKECPYGDRSNYLCNAVLLDISRCYTHQTESICCETCSKVKKPEPDCPYGDHNVAFNSAFGNLNCEQFVRVYTNKECSNTVIKSRCCASCGP